MTIFFQVSWAADVDKWLAVAYERPAIKGQPPTVLVSAHGDEPYDAVQNCCEKLEAT